MHDFILQLGNHDQKRFTSKYGPQRTDLFNILLKTLPGISITYYVSWFSFDLSIHSSHIAVIIVAGIIANFNRTNQSGRRDRHDECVHLLGRHGRSASMPHKPRNVRLGVARSVPNAAAMGRQPQCWLQLGSQNMASTLRKLHHVQYCPAKGGQIQPLEGVQVVAAIERSPGYAWRWTDNGKWRTTQANPNQNHCGFSIRQCKWILFCLLCYRMSMGQECWYTNVSWSTRPPATYISSYWISAARRWPCRWHHCWMACPLSSKWSSHRYNRIHWSPGNFCCLKCAALRLCAFQLMACFAIAVKWWAAHSSA